MSTDLLVWQLLDSAFPAGGFAHSMGLESAFQIANITSGTLSSFIKQTLTNQCTSILPFVKASFTDSEEIESLECLLDAMMTNEVTRRASIAQGKVWIGSASKIFGAHYPQLTKLKNRVLLLSCHHATVFGAVCRILGLSLQTTLQMFLFTTLRTLISSAVRLNICGPMVGQTMQFELAGFCEDSLKTYQHIEVEDAYVSSPMLDLLQGHQDSLYSRIFNT